MLLMMSVRDMLHASLLLYANNTDYTVVQVSEQARTLPSNNETVNKSVSRLICVRGR